MKRCKCGYEPEISHTYKITDMTNNFMIYCPFCGRRTLSYSNVVDAFNEWDKMIEGVKDRYEK